MGSVYIGDAVPICPTDQCHSTSMCNSRQEAEVIPGPVSNLGCVSVQKWYWILDKSRQDWWRRSYLLGSPDLLYEIRGASPVQFGLLKRQRSLLTTSTLSLWDPLQSRNSFTAFSLAHVTWYWRILSLPNVNKTKSRIVPVRQLKSIIHRRKCMCSCQDDNQLVECSSYMLRNRRAPKEWPRPSQLSPQKYLQHNI